MTDPYTPTDPTDDAWLIESTEEPTPYTPTDANDPDEDEYVDLGGEAG
jgi:hypothetical protein